MQSFSRQRFFVRPLFAAFALTLITPATMPLAARADDAGFPLVNDGSARVSFADGRVTIGRGRSGDGFAAGIDSPVLDSDYVSTGAQSHAEIRFDGTALVRLGENVQLRVARLDADGRDVQLAAGTIEVRLLRGIDGQTAIDTPSVSVIPDDTGSYRITVDDHGTTFVTVRSGHAEIQTPHGDRPLTPGTTLVAEGTASDPKISSRDEVAMDGFDAFNQDRDQQRTAGIEAPPISAPAAPSVSFDPGPPGIPSYAQPNVSPAYAPVMLPSYATAYAAPGFYAPPVYSARPVYRPQASVWIFYARSRPIVWRARYRY